MDVRKPPIAQEQERELVGEICQFGFRRDNKSSSRFK